MADTYKERLGRYRSRIQTSVKWREDEKYDETWKRLVDLYALKHFEGFSAQDRIAVAISFATVNVIAPSIAVNHPKTTVLARKPEDNDKAIISEAVLDWLWKSYDIGDQFRLAVKDFLVIGHGWVKTGYRFVEQPEPRPVEDIDADFARQVQEMEAAAAENPDLAGSMPTDEEIMASIPTTTQVVVEDRPYAERVSPFDMFVDPEATHPSNARWFAQRLRRPIEDVRSDRMYDARARRKVRSDVIQRHSQVDRKSVIRRTSDEDCQRVTIWEFYDLDRQEVSVFAENGEGFLVKPSRMPYKIGLPYVMLRNYDVPDQFYPIGDLEAIEPLQHALNRTRSQLMEARKSFARKHLYRPEAFGEAARAALESPDDAMVPVNFGFENLSEVIIPVPTNTIPSELFGYGEMVQSDINVVSGVSEYQRGASPEIRRTATEAAMIQDQVNARSADKLAVIERGIAAVGKNLLSLARQFVTGEQVARITGREGLPIWVPFTQEDIDADVDLEVEGGSTMPKNEAWRQNQAMQMLQALGPMVGSVVDPAELAKWVMQQFGIKSPEKLLMQQMPMGMPGAPGATPMGPGGPQPELPPEAAAPAPQQQAPDGIPPELLLQLQGQVGYDLRDI